MPLWGDNDMYDDLDEEALTKTQLNNDNIISSSPSFDPDKLGKQTKNRLRSMQEAESILKSAGWLNASPDGYSLYESMKPVDSDIITTSTEWKKSVQEKRQDILNTKRQNLISTIQKFDQP